MINKKKSILIVYGPGGHREQAKRLLKLNNSQSLIIELTEQGVQSINNSNIVYKTLPFKNKYKINLYGVMASFTYQLFLTIKIFIKYNPKKVITNGPIIGIVPILLSWCLRKESAFIESWSRFYKPSTTGKILSFFVTKIYIQNIELKKYYPNGIFAGRL